MTKISSNIRFHCINSTNYFWLIVNRKGLNLANSLICNSIHCGYSFICNLICIHFCEWCSACRMRM